MEENEHMQLKQFDSTVDVASDFFDSNSSSQLKASAEMIDENKNICGLISDSNVCVGQKI